MNDRDLAEFIDRQKALFELKNISNKSLSNSSN
jgi:hypothetical protein